jgi:acetate---CoA ligase (ADP-forming)
MSIDETRRLGLLLDPPAVTLVGASESNAVTEILIHNLTLKPECRFTGPLNLVNRRGAVVHGIQAVPAVADIDGPAGLVVLLLPPGGVPPVLDELDPERVSGVVVYSSGAELGAVAAQQAMTDWTRRTAVPLLGPQSIGVARPSRGLLPLIAPLAEPARSGHVSLIMQSAGLLGGATRACMRTGLGVASAISCGNAAGTSVATIATALLRDAETWVLAMYLETVGALSDLADLGALSAELDKPVVLCAGGRSQAGVAAARTHTGALTTPRRVLDGVCRQYDLLLVDDVEELIWVSQALLESNLQSAPLPGIALFGSSGGGGVAMADAVSSVGLELRQPSEASQEIIDPARQLATLNPLDAGAMSLDHPDDYRRKANALARDDRFGILVGHLAPGIPEPDGIERHHFEHALDFVKAARSAGKLPVICTPYADSTSAALDWPGVPTLPGCRRTAVGTRALSLWAERLAPPPDLPAPSLGHSAAEVAGGEAAGDGPAWPASPTIVMGDGVQRLLGHVPAKWPAQVVVRSAADIWDQVRGLRLPFVVKAESPMPHRAIAGALLPGITEREALEHGVAYLLARFGPPVSVAEQLTIDAEYMVGFERDPRYGPLLALGTGGAAVGNEAHIRRLPATPAEIARAVRLQVGGEAALAGMYQLVLAVQEVFLREASIAAIDINPVARVGSDLYVLDAKAHLSSVTAEEFPAAPAEGIRANSN